MGGQFDTFGKIGQIARAPGYLENQKNSIIHQQYLLYPGHGLCGLN